MRRIRLNNNDPDAIVRYRVACAMLACPIVQPPGCYTRWLKLRCGPHLLHSQEAGVKCRLMVYPRQDEVTPLSSMADRTTRNHASSIRTRKPALVRTHRCFQLRAINTARRTDVWEQLLNVILVLSRSRPTLPKYCCALSHTTYV